MTFIIQTKKWVPVGNMTLERNAYEVVCSNSNYSIIAGPGAGKTELLAQRACYLFQTGLCPDPYRILAISFKTDSAKNLKERVAERCSKQDAMRFDSLTFAAFAKSMLDRFMGALPELWRPKYNYELYFPKDSEYQAFLISLIKAAPKNFINLQNLKPKEFEKDWVLGSTLPLEGIQTTCMRAIAAKEWWHACLHLGKKSRLTFQMIERLVELLLRTNPQITNALRGTYSHVFMDEFQDTTHTQYDLIKTSFLNSQAVLTAVGDNKQQIMRWAMAMDDAFSIFEKDFQANSISLISNYRSSPELVRIQDLLAITIDPNYTQVESNKEKNIAEEACVIWDFETQTLEAEHLAKTISNAINIYQLKPKDFVLVVNKLARSYEPCLTEAFKKYDLKVRLTLPNDILDKELTEIFINFLRFGSKEGTNPYWSDCNKILTSIYGIDPEDVRSTRELQDKLDSFHLSLQNKMTNLDFSDDTQVNSILADIENFIGKDYIKLSYPQYQQGDEYEKVIKAISNQLQTSHTNSTDKAWKSILDDFEGIDSVPLMTIHKSKGLEYHTVIFVGLEDSAWINFKEQAQESRSTFFVAFSRAMQRVIFTYCKQRGARDNTRDDISSLYQVLQGAGVKTEQIQV
ncbi:DNA/RNA helicase, superfamily I [Cylindrospermum stagnale PCC 7417]|uniref:DNA 3'-5' helicase n=1 Tax=Cylindrospermum stagnale PCC 7417 TaxID=56107 RepID=K9WX43_9NOST|nr:ATP-dependent helicase [Cylindrospermum stagnale]AFZ24371.1 DNA/RNA helicase, superfamily I [Cylindrospermum stagnale PCC 7417]